MPEFGRRDFLRLMGTGALAAGLGRTGCGSRADKGRPNVVLIFADDLGYGDLSCYGHPTIRTPELDSLAGEGVRLTSFYVAAPSCTPSRASLLTGRYPLRSGLPNVLGPEAQIGIPESEITIAEALKARGYRTECIGKWHLGSNKEAFLPTSNGFDEYFGLLYSNDMKKPFVQTDIPLQLYRGTEPIEHPVDQTTLTTRYTEEALKFIRESSGGPFFLYLAHNMPHLPISTADRFRGKSRAGLYGDVIETIDWGAGEILRELDRQGVADNTIVIFTSDNGPWMNLPDRMLQEGNQWWHVGSPGPLKGSKGTTYEGGMREPCIIRWPGVIPPGRVSMEMATSMDLYVTLIEAAGGDVPSDRPVDGNDITAFLKGDAPTPTGKFYYFAGVWAEAVREREWKFRMSRTLPNGERSESLLKTLNNLDLDPAERYNRIQEKPEMAARLEADLRAFAVELDAKITG